MALAKNMPVPYLGGISQQLINSWSVGRNQWSFFSLGWNLFRAFGRNQSTNNMINKVIAHNPAKLALSANLAGHDACVITQSKRATENQ